MTTNSKEHDSMTLTMDIIEPVRIPVVNATPMPWLRAVHESETLTDEEKKRIWRYAMWADESGYIDASTQMRVNVYNAWVSNRPKEWRLLVEDKGYFRELMHGRKYEGAQLTVPLNEGEVNA